MSTDARVPPFTESVAIPVRGFEMTLLWPLRLVPGGGLEKCRQDDRQEGNKWLDRYAEWIGETDSVWKQCDYFPDWQTDIAGQTREYSEFVYFHPYIHRIFFERGGKHSALRMLTRTDVSAAVIRLKGDGDGPAWRCTARDARLFLFPPGIAIASIRLSNPIWQAGTGTSQVSDFHLSDALDFLDYARRCYPPFWFKQGNCFRAGKVPAHFEWRDRNNQRIGQASDFDLVESSYLQPVRESRTVAVAAHWKSLLAPLQPDPGADQRGKDKDCLYFAQVADDRLPLLAWISVDNPTEISAGDWYRLAFCDDSGKSAGYPYSEAFLKKQSDCFYDRFWDPPAWTTRYACSGYALVAVGSAADGMFTEHVREHMARHYYVLGCWPISKKRRFCIFGSGCRIPSTSSPKPKLAKPAAPSCGRINAGIYRT